MWIVFGLKGVFKVPRVYYKVVNSNLGSAYIGGPFYITYKLNDWVEAKIGGCLVFTEFHAAERFKYMQGMWCRIFKCAGKGLVKLPKYREDVSYMPYKNAEAVWANDICNISSPHEWPSNTKAFKKVKLLEEIT